MQLVFKNIVQCKSEHHFWTQQLLIILYFFLLFMWQYNVKLVIV